MLKTDLTQKKNLRSDLILDGRREFFGSIFYHPARKLYYGFDKDSTRIVLLLQNGLSQSRLFNQIKDINKDNIKNFFLLLQKNNFLDSKFHLKGQLRNNNPPSAYLSAPLRIHLAITSSCPLSCRHCFARTQNQENSPELNFNELKNLVNQMIKIGTRELLIGGGEPFMRKDLIEFLNFALSQKMSIKLFSNGLLIDDDVIKKIKDLDLTYLSISLDSVKKKTYKFIRGQDRITYLKRILKKLTSKCKFPICIQFTAMKQNHKEIGDIFKFAQESGVKLRIRPVNPSQSNPEIKKLLIPYQDYLDLVIKLEKLARKYKIRHEDLNVKQGNIGFKYSKRTIKFSNEIPPYSGFGCPGGNLHCYIDSFGGVYPCGFTKETFPASPMDNIRNTNLFEIWHQGQSFIQKRNLTGNLNCKNCHYYLTCRGGCRARAFFAHENINAPDAWCILHPKLHPTLSYTLQVKHGYTFPETNPRG